MQVERLIMIDGNARLENKLLKLMGNISKMVFSTRDNWREIARQVKVASRARELMIVSYNKWKRGDYDMGELKRLKNNKLCPQSLLSINDEFRELCKELVEPEIWDQFNADEQRFISKAYRMV
jgi:hypothetical protein